ncbi:MAG: hypothetical protein PHD32_06190 [Eubacteriales bacterium]|nr:hypothetical protein [Eubacteriales bacterium]
MKNFVRTTALLLCVLLFATGCTGNRASREAMNLAKGGASQASAQAWLVENSTAAIPGLVKLLNSPREERVQAGQAALSLIGDEAATYLNQHFSELTTRQRCNAAAVIASTASRERIMTLLFLMSYADARDAIVAAIASTGADGASILLTLLDNAQLGSQVKLAFAALDPTVAAAALVPLLQSGNTATAAQAQSMLLALGDHAAAALVEYALHSQTLSDTLRSVLMDNPDTTIPAIAAHSCDVENCPATAAGLLASFGAERIPQVYAALGASGSASAAAVSPAYSKAMGVDAVMDALLNNNITDQGTLAMVSAGFADADSQAALAQYMLKAYDHPTVVNICSALLSDSTAKSYFDALTAASPDGLRALLSGDDGQLAALGGYISCTSHSAALQGAVDGLLPGSDDALYPNLLKSLAYAQDTHFSKIVLDQLNNTASPDLQKAALTALLAAYPEGNKFPFEGMDYTPYSDAVCALLASTDTELQTMGQSLLKCIPETGETFGFFSSIFARYPTQALFQQLSTSYTPSDGGITVSFDDGSTAQIASVSIGISPGWSLIARQDQPDTKKQLTDVLGYAGISEASSGAKLEVSFRCTPLAKSYKGMLSKSYTGAEVTYTMTLTSADGKSKTATGSYTTTPPDTISVTGTMAYLSDPLDGPNLATIKAAYAQGVYKIFGLEALIRMNQQNSELMEPINKTVMN